MLDGIDLEEVQEFLCRVRAVVAFGRDNAEVPVEFYVLERHGLQDAVLDRLARCPGRDDRNADALFHGALDGLGAAQHERDLEAVPFDPVLFQIFQDHLARAGA